MGFEDGDLGGGGGLVAGGDGDRVSLPDEAVTYDIANQLGCKLEMKGKYEEAKVFWLTALEGQRMVLGEEHKDTLGTLNNLGALLGNMKDYEGELGYYQQVIRVQEKTLGKTHPDTLKTIMNMSITYKDGLKDFMKAEEMNRQTLDGHEKSLGKENEETMNCARNLAILLEKIGTRKKDLRKVLDDYPHLEQAESWDV